MTPRIIIPEITENTDNKERLTNILIALNQISRSTPFVLPLHPRTKKMLKEYDLEQLLNNLIVIEPVGFLDMIYLESNAKLIITDTGGVQKEAYFHRVPSVTLRDETEWVETVDAGWNVLPKTLAPDEIVSSIQNMITNKNDRKNISDYGDGKTSEKIVDKMCYSL